MSNANIQFLHNEFPDLGDGEAADLMRQFGQVGRVIDFLNSRGERRRDNAAAASPAAPSSVPPRGRSRRLPTSAEASSRSNSSSSPSSSPPPSVSVSGSSMLPQLWRAAMSLHFTPNPTPATSSHVIRACRLGLECRFLQSSSTTRFYQTYFSLLLAQHVASSDREEALQYANHASEFFLRARDEKELDVWGLCHLGLWIEVFEVLVKARAMVRSWALALQAGNMLLEEILRVRKYVRDLKDGDVGLEEEDLRELELWTPDRFVELTVRAKARMAGCLARTTTNQNLVEALEKLDECMVDLKVVSTREMRDRSTRFRSRTWLQCAELILRVLFDVVITSPSEGEGRLLAMKQFRRFAEQLVEERYFMRKPGHWDMIRWIEATRILEDFVFRKIHPKHADKFPSPRIRRFKGSFVLFFCSETRVLRFFLRDGSVVRADDCQRELATEATHSFLRSIHQFWINKTRLTKRLLTRQIETSKHLAKILLQNLRFRESEHLVFVPDAELMQIPWSVLLIPSLSETPTEGCKFLIQSHPVSVCFSLHASSRVQKYREYVAAQPHAESYFRRKVNSVVVFREEKTTTFQKDGSSVVENDVNYRNRLRATFEPYLRIVSEHLSLANPNIPNVVLRDGSLTPDNLRRVCEKYRPEVVHFALSPQLTRDEYDEELRSCDITEEASFDADLAFRRANVRGYVKTDTGNIPASDFASMSLFHVDLVVIDGRLTPAIPVPDAPGFLDSVGFVRGFLDARVPNVLVRGACWTNILDGFMRDFYQLRPKVGSVLAFQQALTKQMDDVRSDLQCVAAIFLFQLWGGTA